ncbi:MAG: hypothetical protein QF391_07100, partial [Myxococcota bacterium]|nr:hypothetical protein [Myxococcota bacterium]
SAGKPDGISFVTMTSDSSGVVGAPEVALSAGDDVDCSEPPQPTSPQMSTAPAAQQNGLLEIMSLFPRL